MQTIRASLPRHTDKKPLDVVIPCRKSRLVYRGRPLVMGILNVTPDSFSDGGRFVSVKAGITQGRKMAAEGADLIDVGGESTRPGSRSVALDEELRRVMPVIAGLMKVVSIPISIDTCKSEVARRALDTGASIVNDTSAMRFDSKMTDVVARSKAAVILMHMAGTPSSMQRHPRYRAVLEDVAGFLSNAGKIANEAGIESRRILIDPGIGFGKTVTHNLQLMNGLRALVSLGYPVCVGPSRKSFIGATLKAEPEDRLAGTLACVTCAMEQGAHVVRVHDVRETVHFIRMKEAIRGAKELQDICRADLREGNGHGTSWS